MPVHLSIIIGLLFAAALKASGQITEDPGITYNPGEDCLPYDGSVVPDCKLYVDPEIKEPYYKDLQQVYLKFLRIRHVNKICLLLLDCSRFC